MLIYAHMCVDRLLLCWRNHEMKLRKLFYYDARLS